jgi:hypothetical protein
MPGTPTTTGRCGWCTATVRPRHCGCCCLERATPPTGRCGYHRCTSCSAATSGNSRRWPAALRCCSASPSATTTGTCRSGPPRWRPCCPPVRRCCDGRWCVTRGCTRTRSSSAIQPIAPLTHPWCPTTTCGRSPRRWPTDRWAHSARTRQLLRFTASWPRRRSLNSPAARSPKPTSSCRTCSLRPAPKPPTPSTTPGTSSLGGLAARVQAAAGVSVDVGDPGRDLLGGIRAPVDADVLDALGLTAPARRNWLVHGAEVEPQHVHQVQAACYRADPDWLVAAVARHGGRMDRLGLS